MKKIALMLICVLFAACLISCGESNKEPTSKDKHESSTVTNEPTKKVDNEVTKPAEEIDVAPTEEPENNNTSVEYSILEKVKKSSFEEGLVQIGNDVFRNGGYYTVKEFIDEYSDRYDFYAEIGDWNNKVKRSVDEFDSIMVPNEKKSYEYLYGINKKDDRMVIEVCVTGMAYDGKAKRSLNDCVVIIIEPDYPYVFEDENDYSTAEWWLAYGALGEQGTYGIERIIKKEDGSDYEWDEFFDGMNLTEVDSYDTYKLLTNEEAWGKIRKSVREEEGLAAYFVKFKGTEKNKLGVYPTYETTFNYNKDLGFCLSSYDVDAVDIDKYYAQ